ncbi:MAG: hypothetical protein Q8927_03260 [Bacteroidota bacterium]|nr:hypothetical protein [Bacteroidota bacterium]MDP4215193.1 hypothetical protein [Bacteroidota bacterium]MDP4244978.1 hypothetical protein [Bacteroidota bacterium]MDP4255283.1 hypothetical protein [Bacteroidota bacterium]MDP4256715.1 hypothetical protein [Bacteroidota bacterium]
MLLLFAFSMTPKRPLHDLLANHRDVPVKSFGGKIKQLSKSGFNCRCESLVVESSFIGIAFPCLPEPPVIHGQAPCMLTNEGCRQTPPLYFELRGPPAV